MGVPLMLLAASVLQLLSLGYLRLVAVDSAVEGASMAALAGATEQMGNQRAYEVVQALLVPTDPRITTHSGQIGGRAVMATSVSLPAVFFLAPLEVVGNGLAWSEGK